MTNVTTTMKMRQERGYVGKTDMQKAKLLEAIDTFYDHNWQMLKLTQGTLNQKTFTKIEKLLWKLSQELRQGLHIDKGGK